MSLEFCSHVSCTLGNKVLCAAVLTESSSTLSSGTTDDTEACPASLPESGEQDRGEDVYRTEPDKDAEQHGPWTNRSMPKGAHHDKPTPILQWANWHKLSLKSSNGMGYCQLA